MGWKFRNDQMIGHDYPGVCGTGITRFEDDERELGARVALLLDTEDQAWWELIGNALLAEERQTDAG